MKEKVKKTVKASDFMRLSFFANRFGVPLKKICWGVLVSHEDDCEITLRPIVIIKGEKMFIDILNDVIAPFYCLFGNKQYALQAVKTKTQTGYLLKAKNEAVEISNEKLLEAYRSKVFSQKLADEAKKYN